MKAGKSLVELAQEIQRRSASKADYVARTSALEMVGAEPKKADLVLKQSQGPDLVFAVNGIAHEQIAEHVGIPKKYYDRMLEEKPDLLANNVNAWFAKYPAERMVRTLDQRARAFMSDKYRPLENEDLAEAVLPALMELDVDIMSSEVTERKLYIKAVDKRVNRELKRHGAEIGDRSHTFVRIAAPAITISNSEVGYGALRIDAGVYDRFCSNLATYGERSMKRTHVGARHELGEELYAQLSDQTRRISDAALWAQVRDVVKISFEQAAFDALIDKIEGTQADRIEDPVKVIELTGKRFGLNEGERKGILASIIETGELSRFGLANAITAASQKIEDYDRASELERLGGQVIELPKHEWKQLLAA